MNFAESVRFLYSLGHELKTVKWGLERIGALLAELGDPHRKGRFIHVAGTNGKGSTCAMMAAALRVSGFRVGLYTSPHLADPRERIQIEGRIIGQQAWTDAFEAVHSAAEMLLAREIIDAHPSFFETVTAMAFVAFAQAGVDVIVLETGLGGRLDATNVVLPELTVITPIDFDHEAFLGSSLQSIAAEKAGIMKLGRPAVFAEQRPEASSILERRALELEIPVTLSSQWLVKDLSMQKFGSKFLLSADKEIPIVCHLPGRHQVENARTAASALDVFGVSTAAISKGIEMAKWPGRLERVAENPDIILDGAHNPAGARALADYIRQHFISAGDPVRIVYGAMRDKAVDEVIGTLFPLAREVILTTSNQPRALDTGSLLEASDHPNMRVAASTAEALRMCAENPMTTFVTGSLFLAGEARALLVPNAV
ncbi:MAG: bifunctional folylpolyglutamate synthase/dihydrofolate synthase [Acidobacteriota bacterium]|nr:bifunctional folylpolyglutamate synthase/dihydrofolate synthase [Acidobacteriota bacterium]